MAQNRVPEYQRIYQSNPQVPIYFKTKRSKMLIYPFLAIWGFGLLGASWGMVRMVKGQK
ncbi:hypothetical protein SAICODRAFT_28589 [Saitoella complicata NRRL Y-17804]|uniref:uncharacterized protein n=1 Tax=Saitoella complicata (strain BCRC 22490 / CBS 7301 / JCM 7358 / NBRC 10748 / NRRL Y-17804) TaxID=698492 RepID=UPI0008678AE9|nr:uncharacterized protein SAICODRAFT_28589 [Saitoella complicata NRRL Y-17804]ODQ56436.1 hypothetical protein SAICODRAFT_28589 [Saitoella complicata NRRL Y-17804]